jgi:PRTRC genetic system protein C
MVPKEPEKLQKTNPDPPLAVKRIFIADAREFDDPDPNLTPDQVRLMLAEFLPELHSSKIEEATKDGVLYIQFLKVVGTKGDDFPPPEMCPLIMTLEEFDGDCTKEKCNWWSRTHQKCAVLHISDNIAKMPSPAAWHQ